MNNKKQLNTVIWVAMIWSKESSSSASESLSISRVEFMICSLMRWSLEAFWSKLVFRIFSLEFKTFSSVYLLSFKNDKLLDWLILLFSICSGTYYLCKNVFTHLFFYFIILPLNRYSLGLPSTWLVNSDDELLLHITE